MNYLNFVQIAIDGPAGSGKSTIAKYFAKKNPEFTYINTGLMFRALAYFMIKENIDLLTLEKVLKSHLISLNLNDNDIIIYKNDQLYLALNAQILADLNVSKKAALIATNAVVRDFLKLQQQQVAATKNVIMDGRDIGSVVLPEAQIKIFLVADPYVRAQRRFLELQTLNKTSNASLEEIYQQILERDTSDYNRILSPLKKASDAIEIDSTKLSIEQIYEIILKLYMNFKKI